MTALKYLTAEQTERLSAAFVSWHLEKPLRRAKYLAIFLLLRHSGGRISEALSVKTSDFDSVNRTVRMVTLKQKKGKNCYRNIRLPPEIVSRILELRALSMALKKSNSKVSYRVFHRVFKKIARSAGSDISWATPHTMRHSCAIRLLKNGVGVEVVQRRLGHSSINSTMVYAQLSPQDVEDIIESAGAL